MRSLDLWPLQRAQALDRPAPVLGGRLGQHVIPVDERAAGHDGLAGMISRLRRGHVTAFKGRASGTSHTRRRPDAAARLRRPAVHDIRTPFIHPLCTFT